MENKKTGTTQNVSLPHEINLNNRTDLKITGIIEVISATNLQVFAKTSAGDLLVCGENLKILNLNNQDKTLEIQGIINEIKYTQKKKKFLEKVFK